MLMDGIKIEEAEDELVQHPEQVPKSKRRKRSLTSSKTSTVFTNKPLFGKKKKKQSYNAKEEARLEKLVFGDPSDVLNNLKGDYLDTESTENDSDADNKESEVEILAKISSVDGIVSENDSDNDDDKDDDSGDDYKDGESDENDDDDDDDKSVASIKSEEESIIDKDEKVFSKAVAWVDDDDEVSVQDALKLQKRKLPLGRPEKTYSELLHGKYARLMGTPKWAKLNKEKEKGSDDSDDEVLKHSNHIVPKNVKSLPKDKIDLKVLSNINNQTRIEGAYVNCVQFHQQSTVALVGGSSGVLSLFQIDGRENNKLHSIQFERFPIYCARFLKNGTEVLVGSNASKKSNFFKSHCYSYDLMSGTTLRIPLPHGMMKMEKFELSPDGKIIAVVGKSGEIHLLTGSTKEMIGTLQMNKSCTSLAFTPDSTKLLTYGESAEMYVWDLKSRTCLNRAYDEGAVSGSSLAISPDGQFLASGSKQGVVNVYESKHVLDQRTPVPVKRILNLTTIITRLKFNPTSEILAMASEQKVNAFRMLHLPSFQVFSNFPTNNTRMFNPIDIDFSPASGYMALSNNRKFAYLYRLKHYGNY